MRVAHFVVGRCNPNSANGVDQAVYHLSRTQAALSARVAVFSLTAKPPVDIPGVSVHTYPPTVLPFALPGALLSDLAAWRPDVVHLHSVYTPSNAGLAAWLARRRIPYVATPHGGLSRHVLARRWYLKFPYRWAFELRLLNRAMFVHAVGDDEEDIRRYGVSVPIVTAPNGMDLSAMPSGCDRELLLSRVPGARGKRVYMFLGRLDPLHKGLDVLLEGFALARLDDAVLALVGPDWRGSRTALERLTHRLGIATQTAFLGPAYGREKFDLLAGADVFVHPSRWEGMSLAVLEAAASAKPCLVTAAADPRGLLSKSEACVVVEASARSIAEGLSRFASLSSGELEAMGARARQVVEAEFDWARTARTILDAYQAYAQGA